LGLDPIDDLPRFADIFPSRQFFAKTPFQLATAPDPLHEKRLKEKRLGEHLFHSAARVTREAKFVRHRSLITMRGLNFREILKSWLPVVLWIAVMFFGSTDLMSAEHTSRFLEPLLRWLIPGISPQAIAQAHLYLRKAAHLTEYAILASLLFRAVQFWANSFWKRAALAFFPATLFAVGDEFHQAFVPSRTSSLGDVSIDCTGAIIGLALCRWVWARARRKSHAIEQGTARSTQGDV
jgi:VanZ family protein